MVVLVISVLSLVPPLLLGRELCIPIHKVSVVLSSLAKPGETCERLSCCTPAMCYFFFDNSVLTCSLFLASVSFCMFHTSAIKSSVQKLVFQLTRACDADL